MKRVIFLRHADLVVAVAVLTAAAVQRGAVQTITCNSVFPNAGQIGCSSPRATSEYFQRNFAITTSGVEDPPALRYCIGKIGADNIMWAIDCPFQPTPHAVEFIESAPMSETEGHES